MAVKFKKNNAGMRVLFWSVCNENLGKFPY
jgi:hypothetical protein